MGSHIANNLCLATRSFARVLANIDEIWMINTIALEPEDCAPSYLVWPSEEAVKVVLFLT